MAVPISGGLQTTKTVSKASLYATLDTGVKSPINAYVRSNKMSSIPTIVPISELRKDATQIVNKAAKTNQPIVITQRGRASAVLQGVDTYQDTQNQLELLALLVRGDKEINEKVGTDIAEVMRNARTLLTSQAGL
jgi:prevent-host-death family protein